MSAMHRAVLVRPALCAPNTEHGLVANTAHPAKERRAVQTKAPVCLHRAERRICGETEASSTNTPAARREIKDHTSLLWLDIGLADGPLLMLAPHLPYEWMLPLARPRARVGKSNRALLAPLLHALMVPVLPRWRRH